MAKDTGFVAEFKKFIMRGNVMDMAVGVIIGGAFTAIVTSLNKDMLTPLLGLIGGADFTNKFVVLKAGADGVTSFATLAAAQEAGAVCFAYGNFITAVINFLITALVIFCLVKFVNKLSSLGKKEEEPAPAAPTTKICPFCKSEIAIEAVKCPHCTSDLPSEEA